MHSNSICELSFRHTIETLFAVTVHYAARHSVVLGFRIIYSCINR